MTRWIKLNSVIMNRVNRMGSRSSLALWIYLFCMFSLTCCWCWRRQRTTEQAIVLWKWQSHSTKWAARCCMGSHFPAESSGKVTSFLLLAVSVTLYSHWTLSILSLTDENIFDIDRILCPVDLASRIILVNDQLETQFFLCKFISILYKFQATSCSSSGESIVSIQHLVYVTLCRWPS
jgi:hypothetical protein